jgi:hypothetical protein
MLRENLTTTQDNKTQVTLKGKNSKFIKNSHNRQILLETLRKLNNCFTNEILILP